MFLALGTVAEVLEPPRALEPLALQALDPSRALFPALTWPFACFLYLLAAFDPFPVLYLQASYLLCLHSFQECSHLLLFVSGLLVE